MNYADAKLKGIAQELLTQHGVDNSRCDRLWRALRTLLKRLQAAQNQSISYLQLNALESSGFTSDDEYKNAVVNIFTRLNAGGRVLTREEITFAWIKSSWPPGSDHGTADEAIETLRKAMIEADENLPLKTDGMVRMLSLIWSICAREGVAVRDRDLLDGTTVRKMAGWLESNWEIIRGLLPSVCEQLGRLELRFNVQYRSVNALTLLMALRLCFDLRGSKLQLKSQDKEVCGRNADAMLEEHSEAWLVLSQWAGLWSKSTDEVTAEYAKRASKCLVDICALTDGIAASSRLETELLGWLSDLTARAKEFVKRLRAEDRNNVSMYRVPLAIWQRLDDSRAEAATRVSNAATGRRAASVEVDHILPWDIWDKWTNGEEASELKEHGNSIGNCLLLMGTFNKTKSKKPLDVWLAELKLTEFSPAKWKADLNIPEALAAGRADGSLTSLKDMCKLMGDREQQIKVDLEAWVDGKTKKKQDSEAPVLAVPDPLGRSTPLRET